MTKGVFFSESEIRFPNLPISKKKLFQKTILSLKSKFQAQDSFLEYFTPGFPQFDHTVGKISVVAAQR